MPKKQKKRLTGAGSANKDTQRVNASVARLLDSGGARKTFRLKKEAFLALNLCVDWREEKDDTAFINKLLVEEQDRLIKAKQNRSHPKGVTHATSSRSSRSK